MQLLDSYDADPVGALTTALRVVLNLRDAAWPALIAAAPLDDVRRARLLDGDVAALDDLAAELNERRAL